MTDATHTRESGYATTERLSRLKAWVCEMSAVCAQLYPDNVKMEQRWYDLQAATDAFEKSLSTPIPLTPSDEMVEAACEWAYFDWKDAFSEERKLLLRGRMQCAIQAALNLMGGKK